jgi:glycosyltransferase involved in cell wall biosynthesis
MNPPTVSVMVSLFNSARLLPVCAESLKRQTFTDFEVILVDGGSNDATQAIARRLEQEDPRFRFLPASRFKLISEARADALEACRGRYVAVLDSDDRALPTRLEKQVQWMETHPETVLLSTYYRVIDHRGWWLRLKGVSFTHDIEMRWRLTFGNCLTQSTILFRKETAIKAGGYDRAIRAGEDMDFYARLMGYGRLAILPEVLNVWRWHPSSLSKTEPATYKTDFIQTVQSAVLNQLGVPISSALASAVFNQSLRPAENATVFGEALALTHRARDHFAQILQDPAAEKRLLDRSAFLQLIDLFTKNRSQPWWNQVEAFWRETTRALAVNNAAYSWTRDIGLLSYYKKLLKSDWRFISALRKV